MSRERLIPEGVVAAESASERDKRYSYPGQKDGKAAAMRMHYVQLEEGQDGYKRSYVFAVPVVKNLKKLKVGQHAVMKVYEYVPEETKYHTSAMGAQSMYTLPACAGKLVEVFPCVGIERIQEVDGGEMLHVFAEHGRSVSWQFGKAAEGEDAPLKAIIIDRKLEFNAQGQHMQNKKVSLYTPPTEDDVAAAAGASAFEVVAGGASGSGAAASAVAINAGGQYAAELEGIFGSRVAVSAEAGAGVGAAAASAGTPDSGIQGAASDASDASHRSSGGSSGLGAGLFGSRTPSPAAGADESARPSAGTVQSIS